jgi:hypothetical protein
VEAFHMPKTVHRTALACGFALILAAAAAGCSSSNSSNGASSTSSAASSPAAAAGSVPSSGPEADAAKAFADFFAGSSTAADKIALVQNGQAFAQTINAQAGSPMAGSTTATVQSVRLIDPAHAKVDYSIMMGGKSALPNQAGDAVKENGKWKVSAATFCALLTMEQAAPAVCGTSIGTGH